VNSLQESLVNQIIVGGAPSLINLIIHAVLLAVVVRTVRELSTRGQARPAVLTDILIIVATGVLLVVGHFLEVLIWAGTYALVDAAPPGTDLVYFAFSNYTTLGYGDVLPVPHWRLLGPMTALNGILLIGWSTALIFAIIRRGLPAGPVE
jgi:carbon starvation protein CstA